MNQEQTPLFVDGTSKVMATEYMETAWAKKYDMRQKKRQMKRS